MEKRDKVLSKRQQEVLEKYGGGAAKYNAPNMALLTQTEGYMEYDRQVPPPPRLCPVPPR